MLTWELIGLGKQEFTTAGYRWIFVLGVPPGGRRSLPRSWSRALQHRLSQWLGAGSDW